MKRKLLRLFFFLAIPNIALALCSNAGTTLVYVNGITTSLSDAQHDLALLEKILEQNGIKDVYFKNGYNPTHFDGLGDDIESISQAFNAPISDYDLYTILTQIASEVTTRKVLLVGHSQGTFYTNEIYQYLTQNGVPTSSLAVYNIGTPANFVAGGGSYLTSTNDKVINTVRSLEGQWNAPIALPANITIPQESGYAQDVWGGHIPSVYLNGAPDRIAADVQKTLTRLSSSGSSDSSSCIQQPPLGLSYELQNTIFSAADPAMANAEYILTDTQSTVASVLDNTNDILHTAFSDVVFSVIPKPSAQSASGAFAVEKALYGSSLSVADYDALVSGENIPQVEPASPYEPAPEENSSNTQSVQSVPVESVQPPAITPSATSVPNTAATSSGGQLSPPVPISVSPGFGGGAPAAAMSSTMAIPSSDSDIENATSSVASSTDSISTSTTQTTATDATSSAATSTAPDTASTSTVAVVATTTTPVASISLDASPLTDPFDSGFTGWNNYASGWSTATWSTSTSECYSGNCLIETAFNQQYANIKTGDPLSAGSFEIRFRNDGYQGAYGVGVCTDGSASECASPSAIGGAHALIEQVLAYLNDNAWHYFYFAFEDGSSTKQYCGMVDDSTSTDCLWQNSSVPNGTTYSGVLFFNGNGLNREASFYWDELVQG